MVVRTMVSVALAVIVTMMVTSLKGAMLGENVVMGGKKALWFVYDKIMVRLLIVRMHERFPWR